MWHATDLCHHCGACVLYGSKGPLCPSKLSVKQITYSPQGYGPARNIVAFTGGDIGCRPEFYAEAAEKIREVCGKKLWILFETNGYGLVPENLDVLEAAGIDSFWLDIKAYYEETYRRLCGTTNRWILRLPQELKDRGFVFEVLVLYIPGWVETDQIVKIASIVKEADPSIPFTILAFFPEYKLRDVRPPTLMEMAKAYFAVREVGLKNVKLGNCHVFARTEEDWSLLLALVGKEAIG